MGCIASCVFLLLLAECRPKPGRGTAIALCNRRPKPGGSSPQHGSCFRKQMTYLTEIIMRRPKPGSFNLGRVAVQLAFIQEAWRCLPPRAPQTASDSRQLGRRPKITVPFLLSKYPYSSNSIWRSHFDVRGQGSGSQPCPSIHNSTAGIVLCVWFVATMEAVLGNFLLDSFR